ncbi:hypothetical protein ACFP81_03205 [Deinococcus lacus]|uniref:3D domain-containing protein n=1 Tax=Deinococcus lacus TaxID=392561 RepID=A0ABW1YA71_9DEIO
MSRTTLLLGAGLLGVAAWAASAAALPVLPSGDLAASAARQALILPASTVQLTKAAAPVAPQTAAPVAPQAAAPASRTPAAPVARGVAGRTAVLRSTAYNSLASQTDSTPFITATGTRTRFGTVALSRDMLRQFPYGTRIRIEDLSGRYNQLLSGRIFVVEDTMHPRKTRQIDVWMPTRSQALQWGVRNVRITAVR